MAVAGVQLAHLRRVAVRECAEAERFDHRAVPERTGGVRGGESVTQPAGRRCRLGREPAAGQPAHLQAERLAVAPECGHEAARRDAARAVEEAAHRRHPEVEMEERPLADERLRLRSGVLRAPPGVEGIDEGRMRGDMTQMGVVAAGQGMVDERQPRQRLRCGVVEQVRDLAVEESQELHALRRAPAVARHRAAAVAAAVDRRVAPARPAAEIGDLDEPHRRRHDRGHRRRHEVVLGGLEPDRAGAHQRQRLVEIVRPSFEDAGDGGGVQYGLNEGVGRVRGRAAVQQGVRPKPERVRRRAHGGPGGLDRGERLRRVAVGFSKHVSSAAACEATAAALSRTPMTFAPRSGEIP